MQPNAISPVTQNSEAFPAFLLCPPFPISVHLGTVSGEFYQPGLFCQRGQFGPGSWWMLPPDLLQTSRCGVAWQRRACSAGRSDRDSKTPLMSLQRGQGGHVGRAEQTKLSSSLTQQEEAYTCTHTHLPQQTKMELWSGPTRQSCSTNEPILSES